VRLAVAISLGTLAWVIVVGFAIFGFSQQITWRLLKNRTEEILFFAYAISVAGAITGVVACAAAGKKRSAIGACVTNAVLLLASLPTVHWLIYRRIAPNLALAQLLWGSACDCFLFGSILGVCSAVIVSGLVLASVVLERHTKRWQFGLIVSVTVALLGLWVVPVVASGLPELSVSYIGQTWPHLDNTSLFAAGMTGAGTGSLAGAVVTGLMARFMKGSGGVPSHSTSQSQLEEQCSGRWGVYLGPRNPCGLMRGHHECFPQSERPFNSARLAPFAKRCYVTGPRSHLHLKRDRDVGQERPSQGTEAGNVDRLVRGCALVCRRSE
jgi:hypothetical protein